MPTISWKTGDTFQVLSDKQISGTLDVEVYGVFVPTGVITVTKRSPSSGNYSARINFEGNWVIRHEVWSMKDDYPGAVPLYTDSQWMPDEVILIFRAVAMAGENYK